MPKDSAFGTSGGASEGGGGGGIPAAGSQDARSALETRDGRCHRSVKQAQTKISPILGMPADDKLLQHAESTLKVSLLLLGIPIPGDGWADAVSASGDGASLLVKIRI